MAWVDMIYDGVQYFASGEEMYYFDESGEKIL